MNRNSILMVDIAREDGMEYERWNPLVWSSMTAMNAVVQSLYISQWTASG